MEDLRVPLCQAEHGHRKGQAGLEGLRGSGRVALYLGTTTVGKVPLGVIYQ
jgi:hypothetical protein